MVIGLTGGIASGKSTVSSLLEKLGASVIDVDLIGREVVQKGEKAYNEIVKHFGYSILFTNGEINRKKLGDIVFSNPGELQVLNKITHPEIIKRVAKKIKEYKKNGVLDIVVDAAILIEMGLDKYCDSIWLIHVDKETQLNRLIERDRFVYLDALNRIKSQYDSSEKLEVADVIINNNKSLESVGKEIYELWNKTIKGKE
ncbi:MAG: dephospho-CoA kinase [Clostridiales bacterium]|nr:dephospho-CoA kinase [Clostridiales bacterium]